MIRCVRLWTAPDDTSRFEEGTIAMTPSLRGDLASDRADVRSASFAQTAAGGAFAWHPAPVRQLVVTLSGTLEFQTRDDERFVIRQGDVLLAEDTAGRGHSWRSIGDEPWRRMYVVLDETAIVPFIAAPHARGPHDRLSKNET